MDNNFLKSLSKSETDAVKQTTAMPPSLSMRNDGNLYYKDGDVETPMGAVVEVVLLGITPKQPFVNTRKYYDVPYDPTRKDNPPPVCGSPNGVVPYDHAPLRQANTCAECRWSQPGSGNTEKSQKCGSFKTAMMVLAHQPQMKPFMMQVPVTCLSSLSAYIAQAQITEVDIGGEDKIILPLAVYKCQIVRDTDVTSYAKPKFVFTGLYLENEADCIYTTKLACKLDKDERQEQIAAPPAQAQIAASAAPVTPVAQSTPLVDGSPPSIQTQAPDIPSSIAPLAATPLAPAPAAPAAPAAQPPPLVTEAPPVTIEQSAALPSSVTTVDIVAPPAAPPIAAPVGVSVEDPSLETPATRASAFLGAMSDKSQLTELTHMLSLCDKKMIKECQPLFIQVANHLTGEVYDPNIHGKSGTTGMRDYPAITKVGGYKKKRGNVASVAPLVAAPVAPLVAAPVAPLVAAPVAPVAAAPVAPVAAAPVVVTEGGNPAINRILSGLQDLGT